jgi:hypothetical protein
VIALFLSLSLALAQDAVHAVPATKTEIVSGPAVWMTEPRFTSMLIAETNLPVCEEALKKSTADGLLAIRQSLEAYQIAKEQFASDDASLDQAERMIWTQGEQLREQQAKNARLREQRNVAWGIAGGFLAASTAAVVLSLN